MTPQKYIYTQNHAHTNTYTHDLSTKFPRKPELLPHLSWRPPAQSVPGTHSHELPKIMFGTNFPSTKDAFCLLLDVFEVKSAYKSERTAERGRGENNASQPVSPTPVTWNL